MDRKNISGGENHLYKEPAGVIWSRPDRDPLQSKALPAENTALPLYGLSVDWAMHGLYA